jgi:hypothetical protein
MCILVSDTMGYSSGVVFASTIVHDDLRHAILGKPLQLRIVLAP